MSLRIITTAAFVCAGLAAAAAPAYASPHDGVTVMASANYQPFREVMATRHERVLYADLNIDNPIGAKALLSRIRGAANRVCGPHPGIRDIRAYLNYRDCLQGAQDQAVATLNHSIVTALHVQRHGRALSQGVTAAVPK